MPLSPFVPRRPATTRGLALAGLLLLGVAPLAAQERPAGRPPLRIPGLTVRPDGDWCPRRDDGRARELWERTRASYDSAAVDTASLWAPLRNRTARLPVEEVRLPDSIPADPDAATDHGWNVSDAVRDAAGRLFMTQHAEAQGAGERGMNGLWRREWRVRMARRGYAVPYSERGTASADIGGAHQRWEYPPLDAELATHFVEPTFGAAHLLQLEPGTGEAPRIRFCPAPSQRGRPGLEGTLHLAADGALRRVEWRFRTPEGGEGAGGMVEFMPRPAGAVAALPLPARSVYFRRQGLLFFVRQQIFGEWRTGPRAAWLEALGATPVPIVEPQPDPPVRPRRGGAARGGTNKSLDEAAPRRLH